MKRNRNIVASLIFMLIAAVLPSVAFAAVSVSVAPTTAHTQPGGQVQFLATVSGANNVVVNWSLSGTDCSGIACGQISAGLYTAPAVAPPSRIVTVTATSYADPSKSASATVIIGASSGVSVSVVPAAVTLVVGHQQFFTATVTGTNVTGVTWSLSCASGSCGSLNSVGLYTAPPAVPNPAQVSVTATSVADPSKSSSAVVTIAPPVAVQVSPKTVQVIIGTQHQFTATVTGSSNHSVTWSLSGCSGASCGTITPGGLYTAPGTVPNPAQITLTATANADSTKSDTAKITIIPPVAVSVAPKTATLVTGAQHQFTATVTGTSNTLVKWSLSGTGCSGSACGTITSAGLYTAPTAVPNPALITVTATSVADPSKSGSAVVDIVPPVQVNISPKSATVLTGNHQQFTATVTGNANTSVTWKLAGTGCSGAACGTITSTGLYTAPAAVPQPPQVFVTATSSADSSKSGTATVTIVPPVAVSVSPTTAQVATGGHQQFTATVTGTANTGVVWSLAGAGCSGSICGSITTNGLYTAPNTVPSSGRVTVIATSAADTKKSSSATVVITGPAFITISPKTVLLVEGGHQQFTATVTGPANTNVAWSVSGTGCSGAACGTITSTGLYTAPGAVPNPPQIFVTATSLADPTKSATANVTVGPPIAVSVSPKTPTLLTGGHQQFTATVTGTADIKVNWSLSGAGCSGASCGTITSTGLYTAPGAVPNPAQVKVTATSVADSTKSATATVTIIPPIVVKVSPATVQVLAGNRQQFTATVSGTSNTSVTWSVSGAGCSGIQCGIITSGGLYSAPGNTPNPAQVTVTATSVADHSKSGSATVTILPQVAVHVSPQTVQVVVGRHLQFTATVTGTSDTTVKWNVFGSGCSGTACGTISPNGLYTAPANVPNTAQVTVRATSNADGTKSGSASVTVILPFVITISPTSAVVAVNGQQQFRATVNGNGTNAVTWSVSGGGCSGTACGTISSSGLYMAPATVPSTATVIVTVSSQVDASQSESATVTIVENENSKLSGQYAFLFTGFDNGGVYQAAGSFTADGAGNITSGHEDVNNTASPAKNISVTGTYLVGGDNRGVLNLSNTLGTQHFRFALDSQGTKGRFISFDTTGIRGSGVLEQQDPSTFRTSALTRSYALSLTGQDNSGSRIGALAAILPNGAGRIGGGSIDVNDGGVVSQTLLVNGAYKVDSTGRGTMTLIIPGFAGGTFNFALYVVSTDKFFIISTDQLNGNNPIFSGRAEMQSGTPFLLSGFQGDSVFSLAGARANASQVAVGRISFQSNSLLRIEFDQNFGGTVATHVRTGSYDLNINGRGALHFDNLVGIVNGWVMYAIAPNKAFIMDVSSADVGMGELNPQSTEPPFSNGDIVGTYLLGSGEPLVSTASLFSGVINSSGNGFASGAEDISRSSGLFADRLLSGTYSVSQSLNNGRGTLLLTAPDGTTIALWVTSPSEVVGMGINPSNTQPIVLHFEQ
jgi:Fe-S cluster assembly iron-binding protein IscA